MRDASMTMTTKVTFCPMTPVVFRVGLVCRIALNFQRLFREIFIYRPLRKRLIFKGDFFYTRGRSLFHGIIHRQAFFE